MTSSPESSPSSQTYAAVDAFLCGLIESGVRAINASPGSRSTPLIVSALRRSDLEVRIHLDERSAAFAALGEAKAGGAPVALLCTSGTAGAHYFPAIIEAALAGVPLVALTADRPPEHQGWGVGQTIDQRGLYGQHVLAEIAMPVGGSGDVAHARRTGRRVAQTATSERGPVHVNWPFRLPLEPRDALDPPALPSLGRQPPATSGAPRLAPVVEELLVAAERPVIIAGPDSVRTTDQVGSILNFAATIGAPIIADVLSGLRGHDEELVASASGWLGWTSPPQPDLFIHFGHTPTAKNIRLWWESVPTARHLTVGDHREWHDPSHLSAAHVVSSAGAFAEGAANVIGARRDRSFCDEFIDHARTVRNQLQLVRASLRSSIDEHQIASCIGGVGAATVVASSSMPVRDLDAAVDLPSSTEILSNRGANGIDGVIATAVGVARVRSSVRVLIGDVAALHDVGSLVDAVRQGVELTIVVVNNDGGGIFSMLPIHEAIDPESYRTAFRTPHGQTLRFVGGLDGIEYHAVDHIDSLDSIIGSAPSEAVRVVECFVDPDDRRRIDDELRVAVSRRGDNER